MKDILRKLTIFICAFVLFTVSGCDTDTKKPVPSRQASAGEAAVLNIQPPQDSEHTAVLSSPSALKTASLTPSAVDNGTGPEWPEGFIPGVPGPSCSITALQYDEVLIDTYEIEKGPQYVRVELDKMPETEADALIDGIKAGGYAENSIYEKNLQLTKYYAQDGKTVESHRVLFKWFPGDQTALIVLLKPGWASLDGYLAKYDDTGEEDLSPWPEGFLPNCPRPGGKIVDVSYGVSDTPGIESDTCDVSLYHADRQSVAACIAELKKRYYVEADEVDTETEFSYDALSDFYDGGKFDQVTIDFWPESSLLPLPCANVSMSRAR